MKEKPTFYRQRILLALLEIFGGKLTKLDLQKLLFLYTQEHFSSKKPYEFIPYHYGCYSFQAHSDIKTLIGYGFIKNETNNNLIEINRKDYNGLFHLKSSDRKSLESFALAHQKLSGDPLIAHVYKKYPYYTLNSKIAHKFTDSPFTKPATLFPHTSGNFYTIGYEGISFERYINTLIDNDVDILCDVRRNPFSMKFGFSKNMLRHTLENIGIGYMHFPELGIESEDRKSLETLDDYKALFRDYERTTLQTDSAIAALERLKALSYDKKISLTCFEKDIEFCHRGVIAKKLNNLYAMEYTNL